MAFDNILQEEPLGEAPMQSVCFGRPCSPWDDVREFYNFWSSWSTRRPFPEASAFPAEELASAPNRAARRCMEQENEKRRKVQRAKFNAEVREAVAFLKDLDPRVQARAQACAEEARSREALREAEEDRRHAERQERRRAAREHELQRWAEEEGAKPQATKAASAPPTPSYPMPSSPWICVVCDLKGFQSRQAYDDHLATKRHKRNARSSPESVLQTMDSTGISPYMLPSADRPSLEHLPGRTLQGRELSDPKTQGMSRSCNATHVKATMLGCSSSTNPIKESLFFVITGCRKEVYSFQHLSPSATLPIAAQMRKQRQSAV